jgi:hypothetical protein
MRAGPIEPSLVLLDALHNRWVQLFESLTAADWSRKFIHPERGVMTWIPRCRAASHGADYRTAEARMGWISDQSHAQKIGL